MRRRLFLTLAAASAFAPLGARAQGFALTEIHPENPLETAFIRALADESARPAFRQLLMTSEVALAKVNNEDEAPPLLVTLPTGMRAAAIFTSRERLVSVLGENIGCKTMTGREALMAVGDEHVVLNYRLLPMLTLDPDDVEALLNLGPSQAAQRGYAAHQ